MFSKLLGTSNSMSLALVRLALGLVMFPHGAQKVLGWFGGQGLAATMSGFEHQGIPGLFAALAIAAEFLGGIGLILGFLSRVAAFGIFCNMLVAILLVHGRYGFFMNWMGKQGGEGFEYHLLAIGMSLAVVIGGGGAMSMDQALSPRGRTIGWPGRPKLAA